MKKGISKLRKEKKKWQGLEIEGKHKGRKRERKEGERKLLCRRRVGEKWEGKGGIQGGGWGGWKGIEKNEKKREEEKKKVKKTVHER